MLRGHPVALRQEEAHGCAQRSSGHPDGARPPFLRARPVLVGGWLASRGLIKRPEAQRKIKPETYCVEKNGAKLIKEKAKAAADLSAVTPVLEQYGYNWLSSKSCSLLAFRASS